MKQTLKIGAMLLVVAALAMTGVALAQSGDEATTTTTEATTVEATPLRSQIVEWLAPLVDEGTIDQSQAEAVADTLAEALPGLPGRMGRGLEMVREAADFLGLTPEELVDGAARRPDAGRDRRGQRPAPLRPSSTTCPAWPPSTSTNWSPTAASPQSRRPTCWPT